MTKNEAGLKAATATAVGAAPKKDRARSLAPKRRNTEATRNSILSAAIAEFSTHGRTGARTARVVAAAGCNIRMLYHYFGNKDGLYRAALSKVYADLRQAEAQAEFWSASPVDNVTGLTRFTFDYMHANPDFAQMIMVENLSGGKTVAEMPEPFSGSRDLIRTLDKVLAKGHAEGSFAHRPAALDLYLSILGLSFIHISNRHTLSVTFGVDVAGPAFLRARRDTVVQTILASLGVPPD